MSDIRFSNLGELFATRQKEARERNFEGVGRAVDNFIRAQQEEKERLRQQGMEDAKAQREEEDRQARFDTIGDLLNGDDVEMRIAAQHYAQTGDASGFSQVAMNRALESERKKEKEDAADVAYLNDLAELQQLDADAIKGKNLNDPTYKAKRAALMRRIEIDFGKLSAETKEAEGGEKSGTLEAVRQAGERKADEQKGTISNEDLTSGRFDSVKAISDAYDIAEANKDDEYKKNLQEAFITRLANEGKARKDGKLELDKMTAEEKALAKRFGTLKSASASSEAYTAKVAKAKDDYSRITSSAGKRLFKAQAAKKYGINQKDVDSL